MSKVEVLLLLTLWICFNLSYGRCGLRIVRVEDFPDGSAQSIEGRRLMLNDGEMECRSHGRFQVLVRSRSHDSQDACNLVDAPTGPNSAASIFFVVQDIVGDTVSGRSCKIFDDDLAALRFHHIAMMSHATQPLFLTFLSDLIVP
jgi:hypothetical protein